MRRRTATFVAAISFLAAGAFAQSPEPAQESLRSLSDDLAVQSRRALEADARRREARFFEALDPGRAFAATRLDQNKIDAGDHSIEELYRRGGELFQMRFTRALGRGAADLPPVSLVHRSRRGGPDAYSCADCHWRGGPAGAGDASNNAFLDGDGDRPSSAFVRQPIALTGAGYLEILAAQMSADLAVQREALRESAAASEERQSIVLSANGVEFGELKISADGEIDASGVRGIDSDLVVRPFGWKGTYATLREVIEDQLLVHLGLQSEFLVRNASRERIGKAGGDDPDGDGVVREITEGQITALTTYLALQELPQIEPKQAPLVPSTRWAEGRRLFDEIGCAECHVPQMELRDATFVLPSRLGGSSLEIDLLREGGEPRLEPSIDGALRLFLFSDLKRHDLGPEIAEARGDRGVSAREFLTPPLWGLARSAPYLHDGRAPTLDDAILMHGGEAQESRDRYAALDDPSRAPLRIFLTSLTRARRVVVP